MSDEVVHSSEQFPFPRPKRILAILGMHRSGTSCLTGSLQKAGVFLGKHHTWNEHNKRGNRENQDIVNLHEGLLRANDGKWHLPPKTSDWPQRHIDRAKEILAEYRHADFWGFKDPRALFFIEGWQQLVPDIEFVGIYRHPVSVAESLHKRGEFPKDIALDLWHYCNNILLELYQQKPFPILSFDWDEETLHQRLAALQEELGLGAVPGKEDRFFTAQLRTNNDFEEMELPEKVTDLYQKLQDISYKP